MRRYLAALLVPAVVGLAVLIPQAAQATTKLKVVCTDSSGTVVLKITTSAASQAGITRALKATQVAQQTLGVTCTQVPPTTTVSVPNALRLVCTNNVTGAVVFKIVVNQAALHGLQTTVDSIAQAEAVLGVTCGVVTT